MRIPAKRSRGQGRSRTPTPSRRPTTLPSPPVRGGPKGPPPKPPTKTPTKTRPVRAVPKTPTKGRGRGGSGTTGGGPLTQIRGGKSDIRTPRTPRPPKTTPYVRGTKGGKTPPNTGTSTKTKAILDPKGRDTRLKASVEPQTARFNAANSAAAKKANMAPQELINAFNASQRGNAGKSTFTPSQRQLQQAQAGIKGTVPKRQIEQQRLQEQALRMQQQAGRGRQQQGKYGFANPQQEKRFGRMLEVQANFEKKLQEKYRGQRNPQLTPSEKRRLMNFGVSRARMNLQRPNISARDKQNIMNDIRRMQQEMRKLGAPVRSRGGSGTTGPSRGAQIRAGGKSDRRTPRGRRTVAPARPRPRPAIDPTRPPRNRPVTRPRPTTRPRPRPSPPRRTSRNRRRLGGL